MNFIDLKVQYQSIKADVDARIHAVLDHGQYIMGPEVQELESILADYVGVKHCIANASGTDALMLAMLACDLKPGDEVIMPPFTFFATAEIPVLLGLVPVYVDIDPKTYNIDANLIEAAITEKTKAIVPVSLYGQVADMDAINALAKKHNLFVFEDGAQSFGAEYKGKKSCGLSDIGCTSFFPSKPLGCYGDGGACFTDNDDLAQAMRELRVHGQSKRYYHTRVGFNGRLDTLQAAILIAKMKVFPDEVNKRQEVAKRYDEALSDKFITPYIEQHNLSVYAQYTVRITNRDEVQAKLSEQGIPTAVHYPVVLNKQPALQGKDNSQGHAFPHAEKAADEVMSLPFSPWISDRDIQLVVKALFNNVVK
jgi:UDP-2-acetamido-2-deoxy-ribo-hexuluronate aminotransferase